MIRGRNGDRVQSSSVWTTTKTNVCRAQFDLPSMHAVPQQQSSSVEVTVGSSKSQKCDFAIGAVKSAKACGCWICAEVTNLKLHQRALLKAYRAPVRTVRDLLRYRGDSKQALKQKEQSIRTQVRRRDAGTSKRFKRLNKSTHSVPWLGGTATSTFHLRSPDLVNKTPSTTRNTDTGCTRTDTKSSDIKITCVWKHQVATLQVKPLACWSHVLHIITGRPEFPQLRLPFFLHGILTPQTTSKLINTSVQWTEIKKQYKRRIKKLKHATKSSHETNASRGSLAVAFRLSVVDRVSSTSLFAETVMLCSDLCATANV